MSSYPILRIQGQVLSKPPRPRGYAFGAIHHRQSMTHVESNGVMLIINPAGFILTKGSGKGGVSLPMTSLQTSFQDLLNRSARETWTSYYILGKTETKILRTTRTTTYHDVLKQIRQEAKNF